MKMQARRCFASSQGKADRFSLAAKYEGRKRILVGAKRKASAG